MISEAKVFKSLKWLFSFLVGLMGFAAICMIVIVVVFNFTSFSQVLTKAPVDSLPFGNDTFNILSSPIILVLFTLSVLLYGGIFYLVRGFFKNLEMNRIFVQTNVATAKKIALLLLILSIISFLANLYIGITDFSARGDLSSDFISGDLTYLVGATIVWALAKILEKANIIAEENELTI